ncbi:bifunctional glycoside hydrolase 114/ polysaccharide deacetylase family protein [Sulfuriferula thiophila]|uniref:bifunctional glycoside hydrolase 114/ polysaccharide deacetylase family protein n=1 Tax=Sulfuriferula thiophila TaxID=1781211 RepID=UPI000F610299|nr:bifunctional glycoside hydrolase 114/ polysaccharide deacetylase family protein [Sulfuriferula thiophila]
MIKHICTILLLISSLPAYAFNAAFFYGTPFPQELRIYDAVIVEADHTDFAKVPDTLQSKLYAYTSLGEVGPDKPYAGQVPVAAKLARNPAWTSDVMDQTSSAWRSFYLDKIIAPLWQRGFRGVFIDTLDSYQLAAITPQARAAQEAGMVETLKQMRTRFPGMRIILNRGFEILPQVHDWVTAVAAESLFQSWNNATHAYVPVTEPNRAWLLNQLNQIKNNFHLPVIVIDYTAPKDRALARQIAQKIRADGFTPWVSNPELDMIGVGSPEVQPRRVLMLYNGADTKDVIFSDLHRFAAMPVQYMGFIPEYVDISQPLPAYQLAGQYAGIILWADGTRNSTPQLKSWLLTQISQGLRLAVINEFGFDRSNDNLQKFGLNVGDSIPTNNVQIVQQDASVGFEHSVEYFPDSLDIISAGKNSTPILRLKVAGKTTDVAAYTPWGGYILSPFAIYEIPYQQGTRWIINPFTFFKQALNLPDMPVPDVTTSTGRRLLMAHVDGDGFASNAEFPGSPLAPRVMLEKILKKYPIPTAVSVIEAETAPWGLYPKKSAEMEQIAREIFRLPNVEIASHSYSHPFKWQLLSDEGDGEGYNLPLPGYKFNLNRETAGSVDYINQRLAPQGKKCQIFLWTGNCNPNAEAIVKTDSLNLLNMNGGETVITNSQPSLTYVAPLGVQRDGHFQIYAPNQNENVYTNLWTGPFYGFRRVIETFKLTDTPRRLKPMDIYFHTYAASKPASLRALKEVYDWALSQPNHPVFPSEYIRRVVDFNHSVMTREDNNWVFYGDGQIDTLRINSKWGYPALNGTVAGYTDFNNDRYLNLVKASTNRVELTSTPDRAPYLIDANGTLADWQLHAQQIDMTFYSHVDLDFTLMHSNTCSLRDDKGQIIRADKHTQQQYHYQTHVHGRATYHLSC